MMAQKKQSTKRNNVKILLLILGVALLSVLASLAVSEFLLADEPFDIYTLNYDFQIIDEVVFNLDEDILHFGGGLPNSVMERSINITSKKDARVDISWQGPGFITVDKNDFFVEAGVPEVVTFYMKVPELDFGNYSGELVFSFYEK